MDATTIGLGLPPVAVPFTPSHTRAIPIGSTDNPADQIVALVYRAGGSLGQEPVRSTRLLGAVVGGAGSLEGVRRHRWHFMLVEWT